MIDHLHALTSRPTTTSNVPSKERITARRVIDYLKENNYSSSLKKPNTRHGSKLSLLAGKQKRSVRPFQREDVSGETELHT
jgi:hypothetical protein